MLRIQDTRELQAVILALRQANRETVKNINAQSRKVIAPEWQRGVESRTKGKVEARLIGTTARAKVSAQGVTLQVGGLSRRLSGGMTTDDVAAVEFGANRNAKASYRNRSRKGRSYQVNRHHQRQLTWKRKAGPTYKTAENMIPRIASLWVQTVVRGFHDAMEGKTSG